MPETSMSNCRKPGFQMYPFVSMGIGDSVFIEGQTPTGKAASAAKKTAARKGIHFIIRREDGGIRIWRDA